MKAVRARDPRTPEEWQEAVDSANFWLLVHSAQLYHLVEVEAGTDINVARCEEILLRGSAQGIKPREEAIDKFVAEINAESPRHRREALRATRGAAVPRK